VLDRHFLGDQLDDLDVHFEVGEVDRGQSVLLGDEVGELVLLQIAELGDLVAEASAVRARLLAGALELLP
jgi:hypothetical protein